MTTWFTSDLHFGHDNIIKYSGRPYDNVDHMNTVLVKNWNSVVMPDDVVYILGDICMGSIEESLDNVRYMSGHKYLVPGNHDRVHKMYEDQAKYARMLDLYYNVLDDILDEQIFLEEFRLCHFPYNEPGQPDYQGRIKYSEWEPRDDGKILLCGHVHETWAENYTPNGTLMINVGVDVRNYAPISFESIKKIAIDKSRNLQ